jgi:hypothetical protein
MWDKLNFGSNLFVGCTGIVIADGQDLVFLERAGTGDQLLLTIDVYQHVDNEIAHVAKLRRNAWAFNDSNRYEVNTHPANLKLIESESGTVVIEAKVTGPSDIEVPAGTLVTPAGLDVQVYPPPCVETTRLPAGTAYAPLPSIGVRAGALSRRCDPAR